MINPDDFYEEFSSSLETEFGDRLERFLSRDKYFTEDLLDDFCHENEDEIAEYFGKDCFELSHEEWETLVNKIHTKFMLCLRRI